MKIKTITTSVLLLICSIATYGQYYEKSGYLSSLGINGPARWLTAGVNSVDYKGNVYHNVGIDECMGCQTTGHLSKTNIITGVNGWGFNFPTNQGVQNAYGYEDQNGNTYMAWQRDGILNYGGTSYDVTGGYDYALFKYSQNTLQWIIDFDNGLKLYSDTSDNIYVKKSNQFYRKYNSAGVLVDSVTFLASPFPAFMDSLGFFYTYTNDTITKLDFQKNIVWQTSFDFNSVYYDMQGAYIMAYNSDSINLVDLNGNRIAYYNASGSSSGLKFDVDGNYYHGVYRKYSIVNGLIYYDNTINFNSGIMDRSGRFYSFGYKDYSTISTTVSFFLPPAVFRNIGPVNNQYWGEWFNWFQIFSTDTVDKNLNFYVSPNQSTFCSGSQTAYSLNFSINHYPTSLITNGFNVELYDTTGNLPTPLVVGSSNKPPITISIPASVPSDTNYRLRVVPNISGYTTSNNVVYNVKVRTTPSASIAFTNGITGTYPGNVYNCDTIHFSAQTNANNPTYLWQKVFNLGLGQYQYTNLSSTSFYDYTGLGMDNLKLTVTDSNGCSVHTTNSPQFLYPNAAHQICNSDTVNILSGTLSLYPLISMGVDTIYGNNVGAITQNGNTNYVFYPDSAGQGMHYFTWKLKQQNIVGTITCLPDSVIDSVYVITTPFAHISTTSNSNICKGTSVVLKISLGGTPPFNFWLNEGAITTGPYTTNKYAYYINRTPGNSIGYSLDSLTDAAGVYSNAWNGNVSFNVMDIPVPSISALTSTTICVGDSVRLKRAVYYNSYYYTFQWQLRGVDIPGAVDSFYYAKTTGLYNIKATQNSWGCNKVSNSIPVFVACTPIDTSQSSNLKNNNSIGVEVFEIAFTKSENKLNMFFNQPLHIKKAELFTIDGRTIKNISFNDIDKYNVEIKLPILSGGIYFIKLYTRDKVITKKFFYD